MKTSYTLDEVNELVSKYGKSAVLYSTDCPYCSTPFKVRAFTALSQYKKYNKFVPPGQCPDCFKSIRGISTPNPPINAAFPSAYVREISTTGEAPISNVFTIQPTTVQEAPVKDQLWVRKSTYEGKEVKITLTGESDPVVGLCYAFSSYGIALGDMGEPAMYARFYTHDMITSITVYAPNQITAELNKVVASL